MTQWHRSVSNDNVLMTFFSANRPVPLSVIISKASYCSRWELTQKPTIGQCAESGKLCVIVLINTHHPGIRELCRWSAEKNYKKQRGWMIPRKVCLINTSMTRIWNYRDWYSLNKDLQSSIQMESPYWERKQTQISIPNQDSISH